MSKKKKQDKVDEIESGEQLEAAAGNAQSEAEQTEAESEESLDKANAEIKELKDNLLRAYAELENVRKRSRREIDEAGKYAIGKFAASIIEVADNLERALMVEAGKEEDFRKGVQMTLDSWYEVARKFGMERVDATNKPFDPHVHEAMVQVPHDSDAGQVVAQHATGYTLHGRLLRPAKVVVSSGPPKEEG
ncbi:MAG: nucleotide exchange factor GrpE [Mariprofundaceae bacterium]